MKLKRVLAILLVAGITTSSLTGCGGSEPEASSQERNVVQEVTPTPKPTATLTSAPSPTLAPTPTPKMTLSLDITLSDLPSILECDDSLIEFTTCVTDSFTASKSGSTYSNGIVCFTKPDENKLFSILLLRICSSNVLLEGTGR